MIDVDHAGYTEVAISTSEILGVLVDAERVWDALPEDAPERSVIARELIPLRSLYAEVIYTYVPNTTTAERASRRLMDVARAAADAGRQRLGVERGL